MSVNKTSIQRIPDDILSSNDAILAVSLIDMEGNILAAKSTDSFKDRFGVVILVKISLPSYKIKVYIHSTWASKQFDWLIL
jgi:hypothetical protein